MTYLDWQGKGSADNGECGCATNAEQYAREDNPINTIVPEVASSVMGRELITPPTEPENQNKIEDKKILRKCFIRKSLENILLQYNQHQL